MLPKEKSQVKKTIEEQVILLYGPPKIGKSTLASHFNSPLFLATEAGLNHLEVYQAPIPAWEEFLSACKEIAAGKHEFKTVVIDTVDNLHKACRDYVQKKHGFAHEADLGYGKGWDLVKNEFLRALTKLSLLPYGLVLISHAEQKEIKTRTSEISKSVPTMQKGARQIVLGMSDIILFADSVVTDDGEKRILRTKPSENWEAGDRTDRLPAVLPLDYKAFHDAFMGKSPKAEKEESTEKEVK